MKRISKTITVDPSWHFKQKVLKWSQRYDIGVFLESNTASQKINEKYGDYDAILAIGSEKIISTDHINAFEKLKMFLDETKDFLFGFLSYDLKNDVENLSSVNPDQLNFPEMFFFQPKKIFLWRNNSLQVKYLSSCSDEIDKDLDTIKSIELTHELHTARTTILPRISKENYFKKAHNLLNQIHRGDIYEVNFCQEFYAENCDLQPLDIYQKLNHLSQAPFAAYFKMRDNYLICASPERFVKKKALKIITQPIKGTARRLSEKKEDQNLADALSLDPKERAENIMIVDLLRNDLSKNALNGSVVVEELCKVYSFKQVHQLISTVVCRVSRDEHPVDIIKNLFPMGSMTGAPKISAMKIIDDIEETKRGLFSGAVGYFTPDQDFDFNVVIRSILYNQSKQYASFSVGSAITAKSNIEKEYEECLLKAKALKEALNGKE